MPAAGDPQTADGFAAAFRTVEENPLHETIQYALWLAANNPEAPAAQPASSGLAALIDKYNALVEVTGVHYTEVKNAVGMQMEAEVWMKGGKFKVVDKFMNEVVVYDGTTYHKCKLEEKTGDKLPGDMMLGEIDQQLHGSVRSNSASAFQQAGDEKVGPFDCSVYYMEMNAMGITKVTAWVDKETGIVARYATEGEKLMTMDSTVTSLEVGGFGDEVFTLPEDIEWTDYR